MGPQSARSYPGRRLVKPAGPKAQRAKQEIDYGRRGKGYVFGAFRPATGQAFTATYTGRTTANWVDFLGAVEGWIEAGVERVYAVVDNLNVHSATDVLLFALAHPRWEFVFQPTTTVEFVGQAVCRCGVVSSDRFWRRLDGGAARMTRPGRVRASGRRVVAGG